MLFSHRPTPIPVTLAKALLSQRDVQLYARAWQRVGVLDSSLLSTLTLMQTDHNIDVFYHSELYLGRLLRQRSEFCDAHGHKGLFGGSLGGGSQVHKEYLAFAALMDRLSAEARSMDVYRVEDGEAVMGNKLSFPQDTAQTYNRYKKEQKFITLSEQVNKLQVLPSKPQGRFVERSTSSLLARPQSASVVARQARRRSVASLNRHDSARNSSVGELASHMQGMLRKSAILAAQPGETTQAPYPPPRKPVRPQGLRRNSLPGSVTLVSHADRKAQRPSTAQVVRTQVTQMVSGSRRRSQGAKVPRHAKQRQAYKVLLQQKLAKLP